MKLVNLVQVAALPYLASATAVNSYNLVSSFFGRKAVGAAYFITNQPDSNYIVSTEIGQDGKVTLRETVWAGGKGSRADMGNIRAPDPLFSQGSVTVSGSYLYTVNAGSNTLVVFEIDKDDPAKLRMIGEPANTGGEFPNSVAVSTKTGLICVLNTGKVDGISCFKRSGAKGLVAVPGTQRSLNLGQVTPPVGPPNTASQVTFSEDETKLIVSVKGAVNKTEGYLAIWDINAHTNALSENFTKITSPTGGLLTFSLTPIPGKNAFVTSDPAIGFEVFDLNNLSATVYPIPGQRLSCWSVHSKRTGNYYIVDSAAATFFEVSVDKKLKGSVVTGHVITNGSQPTDTEIASIGPKDYAYVLTPGRQSIHVLALDGPGKLRITQELAFADALHTAGLPTDPDNLIGMGLYLV